MDENKIKGGLADKLSITDLATKYSKDDNDYNKVLSKLKKELKIGSKIELEHTNDINKAKEIAMDHLTEIPDYYTRLSKMEKDYENDKTIKETIKKSVYKILRNI